VPVQRVPAHVQQTGLPAAQRRLQVPQVERLEIEFAARALIEADVFEREDHVQLGTSRIGEKQSVLDRRAGRLAHQQARLAAPGDYLAMHRLEEFVHRGPVDRALAGVTVRAGYDWAVRQRTVRPDVLGDEVDDVHPEAVDSTV